MVYKPRVFISHSAKEQEAHDLCAKLNDRLCGGFEVLWDAHLEDSQEWRAAIDEWIWRCDAAVLVLSGAATESRYVAYEAALLRQRWKYTGGQFVLVPVWCPGVTEQVLIAKMGALQLSEIQTGVKLAAWSDAAGAPDRVAEPLECVRSRVVARHDVEDLLIKHLNSGTRDDADLAEIAAGYQMPALPNGGKKDRATLLARMLLDFPGAPGAARFDRLSDGLETMRADLQDANYRVPQIVNLVAPFCWVSPPAAGVLGALAARPEGERRAIFWRRKWGLCEAMYLFRTYCTRSKKKLRIVRVSDRPAAGAASVLDHIRSSAGEEVCNNDEATVEEIAARIAALDRDGFPVYLVIPAAVMNRDFLDTVCAQWPKACVVLHSDQMTEAEAQAAFPGVQLVEPALKADDETNARTGWGDCMNIAGVPYLEREASFLS